MRKLRCCYFQKSQVRPVDWGPNERTKRVLDISPGAATTLKVTTDDVIRGDLILPILS